MFKCELNRQCTLKKIKFCNFFSTNHINSEILSDLFGLSPLESKLYVEKHKLLHRDGQLTIECINACRKLGYTDNQILNTPTLLRRHPIQIVHQHLCLEEGGFHPIGPKILARARQYIRKLISVLKSKNIVNRSTDVPRQFLKYIEDADIANQIPIKHLSDDNAWSEVHKSILQSFLRMKLNATEDEIIRLFRIHKNMNNKSFRVVQENIAFAEELGYDKIKMLKHGYILHSCPEYRKTVFRDFPNLAGADMRRAMFVYPKLITISPANFIKIYGILKEYDIEDELIKKHMSIFQLSPETVKLRLQEIKQSSEFRMLLKHPNLLSFIYHHTRVKTRHTFLQQLKLRCTSFTVLGYKNDEYFNEYVRDGKDSNKYSDVLFFLRNLFNDNGEYRTLKIHPFHLQVPISVMRKTYDFLIGQNYTSDDIYKVMHILLYPQEKIEKKLKEIQINPDINFDSLAPVKKLNVILYLMEKEHHFTGNGIWNNTDEVTDLPEKSAE